MLIDPISIGGCTDFTCRVSVSSQIISADGSEITLPLLCRAPQWTPHTPRGAFEEVKAIVYARRDGQWRQAPFTRAQMAADSNSKDWTPTIPGDYGSARSCAADCRRFVHLKQINPPNTAYHYEVFYSENGVERQITHFNLNGAPLSWPRLSADGKTATVHFGRSIALINVVTGEVAVIPFAGPAWKACTETP
ncbi:hypothetical protein GCM10008941_19950 [Rhizomicrobium palustre]